MASQAQELSQRLKAFNEELAALIRSVPEANWRKQTDEEQWPIGVVARHVGVGHYSVVALAKMMIAGTPIPDFTHDQVDEMNKGHAEKHADCTKEEVLSILDAKGRKLVDYVAGLRDADLAVSANLPGYGGDINVKQVFEAMVLQSGAGHLESLRKTLA